MQTVLDNHFTIGERVYKRIEPPVILHRAISRKDGKQYLLKIWELSNAGTHFLNYSQRFDHENFTLREISKENVPCFPTLIQFESSAIFSEKNPQIISYQVFEDVKFDSLIDYHHTKRMIPERTAIAIYKKIIKTVKLLNSLGKTLFTIDPSYILIDKDINPVFMDFSFSRKLNHAEPISTFDDFHITRSFKPPQAQKKLPTFNLIKMDSFQLGIMALWLFYGGNPFVMNNNKDHKYKMVTQGLFDQLYNILFPKQKKMDKKLWDLICNLINQNPEVRFDSKDIQFTDWWKSTTLQVPVTEFQNFVQSIQDSKLKKSILCQSKPNLDAQSKKHHILFSLPSDGRSSASESYAHLKSQIYKGQNYTNCFFWNLPLCETFSVLQNKAKEYFNMSTISSTRFQLQGSRYQSDKNYEGDEVHLQIQAYKHPESESMTIVRYNLCEEDVFYFDNQFQKCIETFQSIKSYQ